MRELPHLNKKPKVSFASPITSIMPGPPSSEQMREPHTTVTPLPEEIREHFMPKSSSSGKMRETVPHVDSSNPKPYFIHCTQKK